jgi:predicted hydrocarbon binding protein
MHGHFFLGLKNYVVTKYGINSWESTLKESGIGLKNYEVFEIYPDKEGLILVSTVSRITQEPVSKILENLGEDIAPHLIKMYKILFDSNWKTLDLVKNSEDIIHRVIRIKNPELNPPTLKCSCPSPDEVEVTYNSPLKMCAFAKGLLKGIARYYKEKIIVNEKACVLKGSSSCVLSVKLKH